jgi:hypothetical protein
MHPTLFISYNVHISLIDPQVMSGSSYAIGKVVGAITGAALPD